MGLANKIHFKEKDSKVAFCFGITVFAPLTENKEEVTCRKCLNAMWRHGYSVPTESLSRDTLKKRPRIKSRKTLQNN